MKKLSEIMDNFEQYLGTLCSIAMVVLLTIQVFSRYVMKNSLAWTEEVAMILFILSIYFGCAAAVRTGKHLKIDVVLNSLSFKKAKMLKIIANICFMSFCLYIVFPFTIIIEKLYVSNAVSAVTRAPKFLIYAVVLFCLLLTAFRLVQYSIEIYKQTENDASKTHALIDLDEEIKKLTV